ncbi:copper chaperone PCu(A)C [Candidatus Flexifilum breve]|uniref:copper chaperone PCu(A)C n=1 Tax=Candidatus Flexifilum breve TaxID=3140694 RepID=UPI0031CCCFF5
MKSKAVLLTLLLIALFTSVAVLPALAHEGECHATVSLYNGWARASVAGAPNSAAYGLLINLTDEDDTLVSASTDAATSVELHEMSMTAEGVMQMRPVEGGFPVAAHNFFPLQPGGFRIMLMGLTRELTPAACST